MLADALINVMAVFSLGLIGYLWCLGLCEKRQRKEKQLERERERDRRKYWGYI